MKIKSNIVFSILSLFLISCNSKSTKLAIVSGKVDVTKSQKINLRNGTISLAESWANQTDDRDSIITVDEDGSFNIKLNLKKSKLYSFSHQRKKVGFILNPGDSIYINLDSDTIFSGSHALENNYIQLKNKEIDDIERFVVKDEKSFFSTNFSRYNEVIDSLESAYLIKHQKFKDENKLSSVFDDKIKNEIKYRTKFYKIVYPSIHEMYTNDTIDIDQSLFDDIAKGSFDNPQLLELENYVLFLVRYVDIMAAGKLRFRNFYDAGIQKIRPKYKTIKELNANREIKDYLMNEHLKKSISNYGVAYLGDLVEDFEKNCQNDVLKDEILEQYKKASTRRTEPDTIKIYKKIDNIELEAHIFYPKNHSKTNQSPAYVFFHGGGWAVGVPEWGYTNCKRYQEKGMVAISIEYRLLDIHGSNIIDCIKDVNSAILWVRQQAKQLGIDPGKIVAAGFSAGGHLATSAAVLDEFTLNDGKFNSKPNAFIAHSASYNTTKSNFFRRQSNGKPESISTFHNVKKGLPPSIFFHGTYDHLAPISEFTEFKDKMETLGNDFEYKIFNVGHFFGNPEASEEVRVLTDNFLKKQGYIK
ncbi:MAG: alpha/beta hydrolase [Flavobacteriaceae bacterium]